MSELHEQIEKYVTEEMSPEELATFEDLMKKDPNLAEQVTLYKQSEAALANSDLLDFVATLQDVKQEHLQSKKPAQAIRQRRRRPVIWYSAAAVILICLSVFTFWPSSNPNHIDWYNKEFTPYPSQVLRNSSARYPDGLTNALTFYRDGKYDHALELLIPWQNDKTHGTLANFYHAQALMASGKINEAIPEWESQLKAEETVYTQTIQWYLTLSYLQIGETEQAKQQAKEILAIPQHAYTSHAEKLMKDFFE